MKTFDAAVADFVTYVNDLVSEHYTKNYPNLSAPTISCERGKRYVRLVSSGTSRTCYGFVDTTTGDILKSASWKAPAKGVRGNVYNELTWTCAGVHGIAYLTGNISGYVNNNALNNTEKKDAKSAIPRAKRQPKQAYVGHQCPNEGFCERCMST